jgi:tRNA A-37 threonylcarbamoyl transferase component Bud32
MITTPNLRSSLYRRVLDRLFPEKAPERLTSPTLDRALAPIQDDRRVPDRRQRSGTLPGGRRAGDKLRDGFVNRSSSDRRKEPRYIPVNNRAYLSWWQGDTFQTAQADIENLSRSGAAALLGELPPDVNAVWVCFVDARRRGWYSAEVVGVGHHGDGTQRIRIALTHPLPFCVFSAIVWGLRRPECGGGELTTKLVTPPSGSPFREEPSASRRASRHQELPSQIAHYQIIECLGSGGMGQVYLAEDTELERRVALKVMHPHLAKDPSGRLRFLREARAAAAIQHDHIVTIYQVGQHDNIPFLAMQLLEGETLASWIGHAGRPPVAEIVRIGQEIAAGLSAAHRAGLIHRDIKPDNIWLDAGDRRVKLLDFGLARTMAEGPNLTHSGYILGTPAYMSPEQAMNEPCDHRSDLFSLGTVLYRMGAGELPFPGKSAFATLTAVTKGTPRPLEELNPDLPPALVALIGRLLEKKPDDRPADASSVRDALRAIGDSVGGTPARLAPSTPG